MSGPPEQAPSAHRLLRLCLGFLPKQTHSLPYKEAKRETEGASKLQVLQRIPRGETTPSDPKNFEEGAVSVANRVNRCAVRPYNCSTGLS